MRATHPIVNGLQVWALGIFATLASCGGPSQRQCALREWSGTCTQRGVIKTQEIEFPVPTSVFQVDYNPEPNLESPNQNPPRTQIEFRVRASFEGMLRDYLAGYATAPCHMPTPAPGSCVAEPVVV